MITPITIFAAVRNTETGKRERVIVLPETLDCYEASDLIVAYYNKTDDKFYTIPGTEFDDVSNEWLTQFGIA